MSWHGLLRDGVKLRGFDGGSGRSVIFQHGLGGDEAQVAENFPATGFRRLTLECRAHGQSEAGGPKGFSIGGFAGDVLAFAAERQVPRFAVGGISMGAAIALRIAAKQPRRVTALILARPAWSWEPAPQNMQVFAELARFLVDGGREAFEASATARLFAAEAPDNLASLRKFFDRPNPQLVSKLLAAIARDGPDLTELEVRSISVPTLVIGNAIDRVHPLPLARTLASLVPGARFAEIAPKARDKARHAAEFRAVVEDFLNHEGLLP